MLLRRPLPAALAVLAVLLVACGNPPAPAPRASATSTPAPTPTPGRPAPAIVQVENDPTSRPQSGLQGADFVYEYLTEGGITRFSAVYLNPSGGQRVEPVRSARLAALRLVRSYGGVLIYSGASDHVLGMIWDQKIPNFDERADGGRYFSRDGGRQAPHNLVTTPDQVSQAVQKSGRKVTYQLPARGEPAAAGDAGVSRLAFQQTFAHAVTYAYDPAARTYQYSTDTGTMVDAAEGGKPLAITNVVLLRVAHHGAGYTEDVRGEEGVDYDLQGTGKADLYTRGQHYAATWSLPDPNQPLQLLGPDGRDLALPAGLTWVHLVDPDLAINAS